MVLRHIHVRHYLHHFIELAALDVHSGSAQEMLSQIRFQNRSLLSLGTRTRGNHYSGWVNWVKFQYLAVVYFTFPGLNFNPKKDDIQVVVVPASNLADYSDDRKSPSDVLGKSADYADIVGS